MEKKLLSIAMASLLGLASWLPMSVLADIKTVSLSVPTMNCGMCPVTVRMALEQVAGVIEASADLDSLSATVSFDTEKTTEQALIDATTDAGYPSTVIR